MNARADFEQVLDEEERQQRILQALMNLCAAGLRQEADYFAAECGVWSIWKQPMRVHE